MIARRSIAERLSTLGLGRSAAIVAVAFAAGVAIRVVFMLDYRPAFLGIADAGSYIDAAHRSLFDNVYDPAGYPLFLRIVHAVSAHLSLLVLLQHGLGVASAVLMYLAVRRVTGSMLLGLIPASLILFDGYGIWIEHTPISEALFGFLVCAALCAALRAADGRWWLLAFVGVLIAAAGVVRPVGFILTPLIGVWIFWVRAGAARLRMLAVLALSGPVFLLGATYVLVQRAETGFTGITRDSGRILYARVAGFADCSRFTPPAGTAALCEPTPPSERGSFNQYLTGFPDGATQVSPADRSISPAWRVFGPPPRGNAELAAFGWTVILHQPLDYMSAVASDFRYYWSDHHRAFIAAAARIDPGVEQAVISYYGAPGVRGQGLTFVRWYGRSIEVTGVLMIILLLSPLAALLAQDRRARRAAVLLACAGWLLPLASDALASVDPRFVLPAYGPLAAAAAIGLGSPRFHRAILRIRASRRLWPAIRHP